MERHAALGPIAWRAAGLIAYTQDDYGAEITPAEGRPGWAIRFWWPPDARGMCWTGHGHASNLCAARVKIGQFIADERDREARRQAEASFLWRIAQRVMAAAELGVPQGRW